MTVGAFQSNQSAFQDAVSAFLSIENATFNDISAVASCGVGEDCSGRRLQSAPGGNVTVMVTAHVTTLAQVEGVEVALTSEAFPTYMLEAGDVPFPIESVTLSPTVLLAFEAPSPPPLLPDNEGSGIGFQINRPEFIIIVSLGGAGTLLGCCYLLYFFMCRRRKPANTAKADEEAPTSPPERTTPNASPSAPPPTDAEALEWSPSLSHDKKKRAPLPEGYPPALQQYYDELPYANVSSLPPFPTGTSFATSSPPAAESSAERLSGRFRRGLSFERGLKRFQSSLSSLRNLMGELDAVGRRLAVAAGTTPSATEVAEDPALPADGVAPSLYNTARFDALVKELEVKDGASRPSCRAVLFTAASMAHASSFSQHEAGFVDDDEGDTSSDDGDGGEATASSPSSRHPLPPPRPVRKLPTLEYIYSRAKTRPKPEPPPPPTTTALEDELADEGDDDVVEVRAVSVRLAAAASSLSEKSFTHLDPEAVVIDEPEVLDDEYFDDDGVDTPNPALARARTADTGLRI